MRSKAKNIKAGVKAFSKNMEKMMLDYLIITQDDSYLVALVNLLQKYGQSSFLIEGDVSGATKNWLKRCPDCVIFDCCLVEDFTSFCENFSHHTYFVPHALRRDCKEAINFINSRRTIYYLYDPLDDKQISAMLHSLNKRLGRYDEVRSMLNGLS